jgi:hypothetical protein
MAKKYASIDQVPWANPGDILRARLSGLEPRCTYCAKSYRHSDMKTGCGVCVDDTRAVQLPHTMLCTDFTLADKA